MEWLLEEFGPDGFMPMMIMRDGDATRAAELAEEHGLTYPILDDSAMEVFERWNPEMTTPSSTFIHRGMVVEMVGTQWYNALVEELVTEAD